MEQWAIKTFGKKLIRQIHQSFYCQYGTLYLTENLIIPVGICLVTQWAIQICTAIGKGIDNCELRSEKGNIGSMVYEE